MVARIEIRADDYQLHHRSCHPRWPAAMGCTFSINWLPQPALPTKIPSVCFFGHTHVPVAFIRDTVVRGGTYSKFKTEAGKKYFVNVGAVGQPRDNNPKAAYVVFDMDEGTIELRRLDL
jgi:predicted phosphodiesterase